MRIYKYFQRIGKDQYDAVTPVKCNQGKVSTLGTEQLFVLQNMNRSTTVLLRDLNEEDKSQENQGLPLSLLRQFSTKERGVARRRQTMTSILRRSISDSVERNLCYRVGLHQVLNNVMTKLGHENR